MLRFKWSLLPKGPSIWAIVVNCSLRLHSSNFTLSDTLPKFLWGAESGGSLNPAKIAVAMLMMCVFWGGLCTPDVAAAPAISSISPTSANAGTTISAVIFGSGLKDATAVTFSGTGISATPYFTDLDTILLFDVTISSAAATGTRTVTVTSGGQTSAAFSSFTVNPVRPEIRGLSLTTAAPGTTVNATIYGLNMIGVNAVSLGTSDVTATVNPGGTNTSVPVTITVSSAVSPLNVDRNITVSTPSQTSAPFTGFYITSTRLGSWASLTNQPPTEITNCLLLTDGRVMCQEVESPNWYVLKPSITGSYANGAWSPIASMPNGYSPLYFSSAVLPDGRVIVMGGEYDCNVDCDTEIDEAEGALYDPVADQWTALPAPPGWTTIGDSMGIVLANGKYMQSDCCSTKTALFDPLNLTWTNLNSSQQDGSNVEEGWVLLPNGTVLTVDTSDTNIRAEKYDPVSDTWTFTPNPDAALSYLGEIGPGLLTPGGRVIWFGASGRSPNPAGSIDEFSNNSWFRQGLLPNNDGGNDAPAALLPNGSILTQLAPAASIADLGGSPSRFYEYDGQKLRLTTPPTNCLGACNWPSYHGGMLVLPTGQVLLTEHSSHVELYTSPGVPNESWRPVATSVPNRLGLQGTFTIGGTQFNGLSSGAAYGDDLQAATNYPLVRFTNRSTGHVFYARTHDHSSMGVATGNTFVSTKFDIPPGIETGLYDLEVVANGIPSVKLTASLLPPPVISTLSSTSGLRGTSFGITVTGSDFATPFSIDAGPGITFSNVSFSSTVLTATLSIAANALPGLHNLTVFAAGGVSNAVTFTVIPQPPVISSISPLTAGQGSSFNATINGSNLVSGLVLNFGSGIAVSNLILINESLAVANLSVSSSAAVGGRSISVSTAGGASNTVTFTVGAPALTLSKSGSGNGTVTSNPPGINCGSSCATSFTAGQVFALSATPSPGSVFAGWSGDPDCVDGSVTMTSAQNCTARFDRPQSASTLLRGDFDGDGKVDIASFRPSLGDWLVRLSSLNYTIGAGNWYFQWGIAGDLPIVGDFDGDRKADMAVYRPSSGEWLLRLSSRNYAIGAGNWYFQWGLPGDIPLAGDFDGDRKTDIAVYPSVVRGMVSAAFHAKLCDRCRQLVFPVGNFRRRSGHR